MHGRLRRTARQIGSLEPLVVLLAAPLLLFPMFQPAWTVAALVSLLVVWLCRWTGSGWPGLSTPLDLSLLVLFLMVPVATWVSAWPDLALPVLTRLILGMAAFRATVNWAKTTSRLELAAAFFLLLGLGLTVVAVLGVQWVAKWTVLTPILDHIPQPFQGLPGAEGVFHPNVLGGALTLFLPVSLAACWVRGLRFHWLDWAMRLMALLLTLFFAGVLVLTQSRSAWIGIVAGMAAMAWLHWRWMRWLLLVLVVVVVVAFLSAGPEVALAAIFQTLSPDGSEMMVSTVSMAGRLEIWNRALYALRDFALTGFGLGAFDRVVALLYPLFLMGPEAGVHAHNIFLEIALSLGIPGLIAYAAVVGTALWSAWRAATESRLGRGLDDSSPWLATGVVGSLVAFHVFGLTDSILLEAKPGVAFWVLLALAAKLWYTVPISRTLSPYPDTTPGHDAN